jgi:hypothetical protein
MKQVKLIAIVSVLLMQLVVVSAEDFPNPWWNETEPTDEPK